MATLTTLKSQIADDLQRSDIDSQIETSILNAIRAWEHERFGFNERYAVTATLSTSVDAVALSSLPVRFLEIDRLRIQLGDNRTWDDLYARDYYWIMSRQDIKQLAQPLEYCVYADRIHFDTLANKNYPMLIDGLQRLGTSSGSYSASSSDAWFNEARDLIRARAKIDLYLHVIRGGQDQANQMAAAEQQAYKFLKGRVNQLQSSGRVRPSEW